ncbi:unnamed protein product, partial [Brenthis ino]
MEKPTNYKSKNKKSTTNPKASKKRKSDGPTCSMFLAELSRKLAHKKRQEEQSPKNIVQTIINTINNALPVKFLKKIPSRKDSPMKIETLQIYAPELLPNDTIEVPRPIIINNPSLSTLNIQAPPHRSGFKIPRMPLVSSEVFKKPDKKVKSVTEDVAVNTACDHDVASEISKHVVTLKKISLIAQEFNQKTAKNLKEIVDSVQKDLIKKLEEIQAEQRASSSKSEKHISLEEPSEPQRQ